MKVLLVSPATPETFWSFKHAYRNTEHAVLRSLLAKRRLDLLAAHDHH